MEVLVKAGGKLFATLVALVLVCRSVAAADPVEASEAQLKAAFLVNFPKYVEWPEGAFASTNSPVVIVVVGARAIGEEAGKLARGKTFEGHPLLLKYVSKEEAITGDCHILFIGASESRRLPTLVEQFGQAGILIVGESNDCLKNGGMINLAREGKKVSIEVNLPAVNEGRLKISSKLLTVARVQKGKAP